MIAILIILALLIIFEVMFTLKIYIDSFKEGGKSNERRK